MTSFELTSLRHDLAALRVVAQKELDLAHSWAQISPRLALWLIQLCSTLLEIVVKDCLLGRIHVTALDEISPIAPRKKDTLKS